MRVNPKFPRRRVDMPMRRAEYTIYKILQETRLRGRALYEAGYLPMPGRSTSPYGWKP